MDGTKPNHQEPAEEMPFTEYEYVKLGTITMMCETHQIEMIFIDDKEALCPQCVATDLDCDLDEAKETISIIATAMKDEEE